jgi:hypothetical protein
VAEVRYGIARLPAGRRHQALLLAADEVFEAFPDAVLATRNVRDFDGTGVRTVDPWRETRPRRR